MAIVRKILHHPLDSYLLNRRKRLQLDQGAEVPAKSSNNTECYEWDMLHDVKVLHQPTSAVGSTHSLLPNRAFNVGFNSREMMADYSIITWSDDAGNSYRQQIELPKNVARDTRPKNLTYTIYDDNTVAIILNPSE